ncbi:hypothetical protein CORC01_03931 [Colletotrichum orchidophilum]|uniref:Uncharacterized protein n=1 Tax=Colletotrichum orchidophilum TaxID=1209926 RepID=A0A1G4BHV4_9PEZI|nr:uncharacterized protein CORC01_03931 [Colletotrichum orchidophilum]OHF00857.1 hypothetical protein CORC01_03931 [Colletotrichum orchidophilum]
MRFFALASLVAVAAALPAALAPAEQSTDLTSRSESFTAPAIVLERAAGGNPVDLTYSWPADTISWIGLDVQFQATNLGNGKYSFEFWNSGPANGGSWNFRVSNAGNTLGQKDVAPASHATIEVQQTGSNFNIYIQSV